MNKIINIIKTDIDCNWDWKPNKNKYITGTVAAIHGFNDTDRDCMYNIRHNRFTYIHIIEMNCIKPNMQTNTWFQFQRSKIMMIVILLI